MLFTSRLLMALCLSLNIYSFAPDTAGFTIHGKVEFKNKEQGSTEGLIMQVCVGSEAIGETRVNHNQYFSIDFTDLNFGAINLCWKEEGGPSYLIRKVEIPEIIDQVLWLNITI